MDMTEKNGQPSMEEILASIRRIVAEEPEPHGPEATASGPVVDFRNNPITLNKDGVLDDSEFDLPAIFRSSAAPATEKPGPLIGRLTDALRNATGNQPEQKQMQTAEESSDKDGEHGHEERPGTPSESYPALSSLKPACSAGLPLAASDVRGPELAPAQTLKPVQTWRFARATPPPAAIDEEIKRVMAPFKDTHFLRMSGTPAKAPGAADFSPLKAPLPQAPASADETVSTPVQEGPPAVHLFPLVPARLERLDASGDDARNRLPAGPPPPPVTALARRETPFEPASSQPAAPFAGTLAAPAMVAAPQHAEAVLSPVGPTVPHEATARGPVKHEEALSPPPLSPAAFESSNGVLRPSAPLAAGEGQPTSSIEDTTAELLRPMLRQWLADNMPRMVEKALHIEVAESIRPGKKPTGS